MAKPWSIPVRVHHPISSLFPSPCSCIFLLSHTSYLTFLNFLLVFIVLYTTRSCLVVARLGSSRTSDLLDRLLHIPAPTALCLREIQLLRNLLFTSFSLSSPRPQRCLTTRRTRAPPGTLRPSNLIPRRSTRTLALSPVPPGHRQLLRSSQTD